MKIVKFFTYSTVLSLCMFLVTCDTSDYSPEINIGDYDNQLEAWNDQNMLDYQIKAENYSSSSQTNRLDYITVRNGLPESGSPTIPGLSFTTIPELYSWFIEEKNGNNPNSSFDSLTVSYNTEYHYPNKIIMNWTGSSKSYTSSWNITVMPLEEGELDIDIGDYETHLEAWNNQNMLDYQLKVGKPHGEYDYHSFGISADYNVKNGIPDRDTTVFHKELKAATVLRIYTFIKEQEERIRNIYNEKERSYLHVQYDTEYHYPTQISLGIGHEFGYYERWEFALTPEEP